MMGGLQRSDYQPVRDCPTQETARFRKVGDSCFLSLSLGGGDDILQAQFKQLLSVYRSHVFKFAESHSPKFRNPRILSFRIRG